MMRPPQDNDGDVVSETELPILPDELIEEIMMRLPVSSLVRFRVVCKSWKTLIQSPKFVKDHLQHSVSDPNLTQPRYVSSHPFTCFHTISIFSIQSLLQNPSVPIKVIPFEIEHNEPVSVLGSCNGLLCLHQTRLCVDYECFVMLWNPCTGSASKWIGIDIAVKMSGFGYDHVHGRYKLFVSNGTKAKIYTFGSKDLRTIDDFPYLVTVRLGLLVSGTLNWIYQNTVNWMIVSLDLGKETYSQLSLPDKNDLVMAPRLGVLRNCLAVGCDYKRTHWAVWLMKEYGVTQSWTKLAMIPHDPIGHRIHVRSLEPLYIKGNDVLLARVQDPQSTIFQFGMYDLNNGRLDFPLIDNSSYYFNPEILDMHQGSLLVYHESLLSPSHLGLTSSFTKMPLNKYIRNTRLGLYLLYI